jgi:hypothetical protein
MAMLTPDIAPTVSALCDSIVVSRCAPAHSELREHHAELTRFVLAQQDRMPDYLRWPFRILTILFDLFGLVYAGRLFRSQDQATRWRQIEAWRTAPFFSPARDFIRFYESLVLYRWYAEHEL